jgi:hypothetical protein
MMMGFAVAIISPTDFEWSSLGTAFVCVFLAGLVSLMVTAKTSRKTGNSVTGVLIGTITRATMIGILLIVVVATQRKNFALYVLCFSILFYLAMISLNAWLVTPVKHNRHEAGSSRDKSNGYS